MAWAKPYVFPSASIVEGASRSNARDREASLLARAIDHIKHGGDAKSAPLTNEWANWIVKLRDYVRTVHDNSGHSVRRVVITSGRWLVIFCDPAAAFLRDGSAAKTQILCFYRADLIDRSNEIHEWLAWKALIRDPPAQLRPAQLRSYISGPDIGSVFRALWVVYRKDGAHFDLRPQLTIYPALIVEHSDDILITVIDEDQRFIVPHDPGLLPQHIREVADGSNALLQAVNTELESSVVPAGIERFPGFQEPQAPSLIPDLRPTSAKIELLKAWRSGTNEFLLVTGSYPHFLHPEPTVAGCRFHDWAACHALGQHQGDHPIAVRSVKPQSFFRSTEEHHCAHR